MIQYQEIVAKILRPEQPHLDDALLAVMDGSSQNHTESLRRMKERHPTKTRELWERLVARGLLPDSWLNDERRCFGQLDQRDTTTPTAIPTDEMTALCIGADRRGIETAERLAFEVLSRLSEWYDTPKPERILWIFGELDFWDWGTSLEENRGHLFEEFQVLMPSSITERARVERAVRAIGDTNTAFKRAVISGWESTFSIAARDISYAYLWRVQAEKRVPQQDTYMDRPFPEAVRGRFFKDLRSPFAALADLWAQGYVFADFNEDAIILLGRSFAKVVG